MEIGKLKNFSQPMLNKKLIVGDSKMRMKKVEILDFSGKQLFLAETPDKEIIVPNLQNGQYILKIMETNTTALYKVLVK